MYEMYSYLLLSLLSWVAALNLSSLVESSGVDSEVNTREVMSLHDMNYILTWLPLFVLVSLFEIFFPIFYFFFSW